MGLTTNQADLNTTINNDMIQRKTEREESNRMTAEQNERNAEMLAESIRNTNRIFEKIIDIAKVPSNNERQQKESPELNRSENSVENQTPSDTTKTCSDCME